MKLNLITRSLVIVSSLVLGIGTAIGVNAAQERGYATYESVYKTGSGTVYSLSTGTNTFYIRYGGSCNTSEIRITPQVYMSESGKYEDTVNLYIDLKAGESDERRVYCSPFKIFRVKVSDPRLLTDTGTGMGYIQGLE